MPDSHAIKVVIRAPDGRFLKGQPKDRSFTTDRAEARVFDYVRDGIAEQLDELRVDQGIQWVAEPIDPRERYEVCDSCGKRVMSFKAYYDGRRYLCPECRPRTGI
jgi:hypothetical protein